MAWMEALISVGIVTGILMGPIIFQAYGYTIVFGCAAICCIVAGLYIYLLVPETTYTRDTVCTLSFVISVFLLLQIDQ